MTCQLLLAVSLLAADLPRVEITSDVTAATATAAAQSPDLAKQADASFLLRVWPRAIDQYGRLVAANPTNGFSWYRLGYSLLEAGRYDDAIEPLTRADELGGFQWNPPRMFYRGEAAYLLAAAHARAGRRDEALRWTRTALTQGLRDIRRFQEKHFASLSNDDEFRRLVWATNVQGMSREEGFRHDLRFLLHEAQRIHFDPYRLTTRGEFDELARRLEDDIPRLSDDQIQVRLMEIVARLGDGHTQLGRGPTPRLPIWLFQFPEGLYVWAALEPQAELVGAKVLSIGNCTVEEAWRRTEPITPRDNLMTVRLFVPILLGSRTILSGLGIAPGDGPVSLEIEDPAGERRRVELKAEVRPRDDAQWLQRVAGNDRPLPISLRPRAKTYWFEVLADERLLYCQLNGIGTDNQKTLPDFCRQVFAAAEGPEVDSLVIDLRYNGGGNTFTNPALIEGIIRSDKLNRHGKLFVVIGRHTFSAAQNTTSELERRTKAILVGEPTGSCPNFIGESLPIRLPYSGWGFSASDLWWQHSMAMDYRTWTPPHMYAPPTAAAFRAHADPAMEAIAAFRARAAGPQQK